MLNFLSALKGGNKMNNNGYPTMPSQQMSNSCNNGSCNLNQPGASQYPQTPPPPVTSSDYPYGQFPAKFTKAGQQAIKEQYTNQYSPNQTKMQYPNNIYPNQPMQNNYPNNSQPTYQNNNGNYQNYGGGFNPMGNSNNFQNNNTEYQNNYQPPQTNNALGGLGGLANLGGLGGLLGGLGGGSGLDINSLLPLLTGGKQNDMLKNMMPLLNKGGNFNQKELINLITKGISKTSTESESPTPPPQNIDDFKRI